MNWVDAGPAALADGEYSVVLLTAGEVLVYNLGGEYVAVANVCSHDGGEIAGGEVTDGQIVCPRHGARFCLKTGAVLCAPAYEDIPVFPVRVDAGRIWVGDDLV
jgi:3-phenylpropionate/trans-cinnamate dioxygenase ferredoxin component